MGNFLTLLGAGGPTLVVQTKAIDFDGSTEQMANTSASFSLAANTVSIWINADVVNSGATEGRFIAFQNSSNQNIMYIQFYQSNWYCIYGVGGASGIIQSGTPSTATNYNVVLRTDATTGANAMTLWVNGASVASATPGATLSGTVTQVFMGNGNGSQYYNGRLCRADYWDTNLPDNAVTAIYDSGNGYQLDLRNSKGNYTQTSNLKHQWLLGYDSASIGYDYVSSGNVDMMANATNISAADIVNF